MIRLTAAGNCCLRQCLVFLVSGLLLWRTAHCQGTGAVNGFINFAQPSLIVDEGPASQTFTTVSIPLVREGGTTGNVFVTITIQGDASADFFGTNIVATFSNGVTQSSATVVIRNDPVPEGNETFTVEITGARFGAEVGERNTMQLIIRASDEPYGAFQFESASLVREVSEPASGETTLQLTIVRGPGIFGRVTVDFELQGTSGLDDLTPAQGQLVFEDQVASQNLTLTVLSDNLPEPDEVFTVVLTTPGGGATLASSNTQASVTILANDSPLRWSLAQVEADESGGSVQLTILRGQLEDGSSAGDLSVPTTVQVSTTAGSATSSDDFNPLSVTITFPAGSTSQTVSIAIVDDSIPEGDEIFTVTLSSPSADAVLIPASNVTVIIPINDNAGGLVAFGSPGPIVIQEDGASGTTAQFVVQRTVGTLSNLTVEWEIANNIDGSIATADFQPARGNVTIPDGQSQVPLLIRAVDDSLPEVAEGFMVRLVRVAQGEGDLSDTGVRVASLIVAESDDVYGLVEWAESSSLTVTSTLSSRELQLAISRSGGSVGTIVVDYSIIYLPSGVSDPLQGSTGVVAPAMGSVQIQDGQSSLQFSVPLMSDAFLEEGSSFYVRLDNTTLVGGVTPLIPAVNSPSLGDRIQAIVSVPSTALNGIIGFALESLEVGVEEPSDFPTTVQLTLTRSGSFGAALITWAITPINTDLSDTGTNTGTVTFPSGSNTTQLEIFIFPDDEPEVDELFTVTLVAVTPSSQRINADLSSVVVTILKNDDADGIFSIAAISQGPLFIEETPTSVLQITIVRSRGALTNIVLQYSIPGAESEIIGGVGLVNFVPDQTEANVSLLINDDDIPETNETYTFSISAVDGNTAILGSPTSVSVTILPNDDYAGLFLFSADSLEAVIAEPPRDSSVETLPSTTTLTVMRNRGTFTDISVTWQVTTPSAALDITPTDGILNFAAGQTSASFQITALADEVPEGNETLAVQLTSASGDGRLAAGVLIQASLTVLHNDDPVSFDQSVVVAYEGERAVFTVNRGGQVNGVAQVTFEVAYSTASTNDVIITPAGGVVNFVDGQSTATISVDVVDDSIPEESEILTIRLISVSGDAVLVTQREATLQLSPSDDPNGVFQFNSNFILLSVQEGDSVDLLVERLAGDFGTVDLRWTVRLLQDSSQAATSRPDLFPTSGILIFGPGNRSALISFDIIDDSLPELSEVYEVELSIFNIIGETNDGASLGDTNTSTIVVQESDDPYGLLSISQASADLEIAEDIPADNLGFGMATVQVERMRGNIGNIRVLWEVLPVDVVLPSFVNLLFLGDRGASVQTAPSRPDTGTQALLFAAANGAAGLVTVPPQYQPDIGDGFTISLWMQTAAIANGVLVAKVMDGTSLSYYSLSFVADSSDYLFQFSFLPEGASTQRSVEVSFPQSQLPLGAWHSLSVVVGGGSARFYTNGVFRGSRSIGSSQLANGPGQLTVGGVAAGSFFSGTLQDVRIYSAALSDSQVLDIATDEATESVTPVSGYVDFAATETSGMFAFSSKDDSTPEPSQFFTISLANSNGGSRIDPALSSAQLTVLKSDSSNGVFGFDITSRTASASEPGTVSLLVNRERGLFGSVLVAWEVYQLNNGVVSTLPAMEDFDPVASILEFEEGEMQSELRVMIADELVPELQEQFIVMLVAAVANDSEVSSTPFSGAYINTTISQSTITVGENDFPYGLFQFVTSPPTPGVPITPATVPPVLNVRESDGIATIYVVRAQGTVGTVSVEYFTFDASATSQGLDPDFTSAAGRLDFSGDTVVGSFPIILLDDSAAELGKTFYINLTNPQGDVMDPSLSSIGSVLTVNIEPSDDAFGRFGFTPESQSRVVVEQSGGTPVTLMVTRQGGQFGDVSVYWSVSQSGGMLGSTMDISPSEGVLEFAEGENQMNIMLVVNDDLDAELLEVFTVQLVNATAGASLGPVAMATITVEANDHPYGRFVFTSAYRPLVGNTEGSEVEIVVTREFGTLGEVTVDYASIASSNVATDPALMGVIDVQQLINERQIADNGVDYVAISGSLVFGGGVTSRSFNLSFLEDTTPETDEYIFIAITNVQLNQSSVDVVDPGALPSVAPGNDSVAFIVISENDDARGVVELSGSRVETPEPSQDFISVLRQAGTFGEIIVQWEALSGTATSADYSPTRGVVTLANGVQSAPIPLSITEETIPEFSEQFTVRLVGVVGGARLGRLTSATVTITASDNPNGAIQFAADDRSVEVNEGDTQSTLTLTVERVGGAVGVVQVQWNLTTSNGGDPSADIRPTSGSLQFITNARRQTIALTVLPDDLPEVDESFVVQLISATGGAALLEYTQATVTILGNDNPFGVISLQSPSAVTMEVGDNGTSVAMVTVIRELGVFGDIRVLYSIQSANAAELALAAEGASLFGYFASPITDFALVPSAILRFVTDATLESCAMACLSDQACLSFAHDETTSLCQLYLVTSDGTNSVVQTGPVYYEKFQAMVLPYYRGVAVGGSDFTTAVGQSVVIPTGLSTAQIPVTVFGDATPELNESLVVTITGVEVVTSGDVPAPTSTPLLGNQTSSILTILENDDPHGVFVVYGSGGAGEVYIGEPDTFSFGVMLTVERSRGTFGDVSVRWNLEDGTAMENVDYAGSGMELRFADSESRTTVALTILDDNEPEIDETFMVTLTNPTGGARVAPGDEGRTLIIIEANDAAAGVVGLAPLSRSTVVGEGESAILTLVREVSTFGAVEVEWLISGTSGNASLEFVSVSGVARFEEGENTTEIVVSVRSDPTPEIEERYTLELIAITTISDVISLSGAAVFEEQGTTSSITIRASNNPHGVIQFQQSSLVARSQDGMSVQFTIIREFGTFGTIRVVYTPRAGNVTALTSGQSLATASADFVSLPMEVILQDMQQSAVISVDVLEDDVPEIEEVFLVELDSVNLVGGPASGIPPSLGDNTVAEVIVAPNDSPQGAITFAQDTDFITESAGTVGVVVSREQGAFGRVSAFYFVNSGTAVSGQDFSISVPFGEVVFEQDQDTAVINVNIIDDDISEVDEEFCVLLSSPQGGAMLGNITTTCITILPSDDPYGVFSFEELSLSRTISEPQGAPSTANVAQLTVVRNRGLFGQVTVPFEVRQMGSQQVALPVDLRPTMGALIFNPNDRTRVIQIEALMDDLPETDETFFVSLLAPPTLGRLSETATIATIIIQANQNPFGVIELSAVGVTGSQLSVEEDVGSIEFELTRSFGTFDEVSVTLDTVPGTAVSIPGMTFSLDPLQSLDTSSADLWYSFSTAFGRLFLALASGSQAVLYGWRGVFVPVQTLTTNNASGFTYISPSRGVDLLVVTNRGVRTNREVNSHVYRFTQEEQLSLVQSIPTQGASDVVSFNVGGSCYIVVANGEDNDINPNVDTVIYRWSGSAFVQFQRLSTIGASAMATFIYRDELNLAIASLTDTRSSVYVWISGQFRLDHTFTTQRATDIVFLSLLGVPHLGVSSETTGLSLLRISEMTGQFVFNRTLSSNGPVKLEVPSAVLSLGDVDFVTLPPVTTTAAAPTTAAQPPATTAAPLTSQMTATSQPQTTAEPVATSEEVTPPQTTLPPTTQAPTTLPPTTLPPTTLPPTTLPPTTLPPTTLPPTTLPPTTLPPTTLPPTTLPPTTLPPTTLPPTTLPPTTLPPTTLPPTTLPPTTLPPTTLPPTTLPPTTLPPTTLPPTTDMVITDDDGKPIETTIGEMTTPEQTMPPTTLPPTTMVTDDDGKPVDPGPGTTIVETLPPTTQPPETTQPPDSTTTPPETTQPPEATTTPPETTQPPDSTTTPPEMTTTQGEFQQTTVPATTANSGPTEKPTDYGEYGDGGAAARRRRRRRDTFGAQPPSTAIDSKLLVVTNSQGAGQLFTFVEGVPAELSGVAVPNSTHLYPFQVGNSTYLAAAGVVQGQPPTETSVIFETVTIDPQNTDYYNRDTVLTLRSGESSLRFVLGIVDDVIPEIDENFDLQLTSPMGGVTLGSQQSVTVTVLNNDNAHGLIGFAEGSLSIVTPELNTFTTVNLALVREAGLFGHVTVTWELTGDHSQGEVTPTSGIAVFPEGVSMATITLVFQPDSVPELNEVTRVRLTSATVQGGGVNQPQLITGRQEAVITVEANDAPHGVISWSPISVTTMETDGMDNTVQLTIVREFGTIGSVVIGYSTLATSSLPSEQRAEPLMDFVPATSEVVMGDGQSSSTITLTILHDNTPEVAESFLVNITSVRLASESDRGGSITNSPRLLTGGEVVTVQIQENDNSRGVIDVAFTSASVAEEPNAAVTLELVRTRGAFGTVGVNYIVRPGSASLDDVSRATASGTVQFINGQQRTMFAINIVNDALPELDEMFTVELESATDGAQIGDQNIITVTILANDDINGVFSFSNTSLLLVVSESVSSNDPMGVVTLTVERSTGFVGEVVVYWEVEDDGLDDIEPAGGNLTFADGVRQQSFQIRAVDDGIPELFEAFAISLTSTEGGGRITDPRESRIAIRSSNDPNGVVSLQQFPQGLLVNEGAELRVDVFRSAGTVGTVTATWALTPPDSSVFVTTSDTVVFTDRQTRATIVVQSLTDQTPEVARLFTLAIVSTTFASVNTNASQVLVVVPASNNPHGLVEFDQISSEVMLNEDVGMVVLDLVRTQGVIGTLRVNFSVLLSSASNSDFSISTDYAIIPDGSTAGNITVMIVNDDMAELEERFSIRLDSVEVIGDSGRNFDTGLDPSLVDQPPSLGPSAATTVVILPSDDPYGTISLIQSRYEAVEGDTVTIPVIRTGGSLATVSVQYSTTNGGAEVNSDFEFSSGVLVFIPGQDMGQIIVRIIDDTLPETEENFDVSISNPTLAALGSISLATIFIDANDSPFGTIGFDPAAVSGVSIANPTIQSGPVSVFLTVVRTPGANMQSVQTDINWSVSRSSAGGLPLTDDIDVSTVSGVLTIANGQMSGMIEIIVLPSSVDEAEEMFTVSLNRVSNNIFLDSTRSQATITVNQRGSPFGEVSFLGESLAGVRTNEQSTNSTVSLSVARTGDLSGAIQVSFAVTRVGGSQDPVELDLLPSSGFVILPSGIGQVSLLLTVLADDISEMDETFAVALTRSTGGAVINSQAATATLIINSNDAPFGEYGVSNVALTAVTSGQVISRTLSFDITRSGGNLGTTQVTVNITYDQNPLAEFVTRPVVRSFAPDQTIQQVSLPVNQDAFLAPGATITLSVVRAEVTSPSELAGGLGDAAAPAQLVIGDDVANPIVFFTQQSLSASVNDSVVNGNVMLTVNRRGQLGDVEVTWTAASIPGSLFSVGSTTPATNSFTLTPTNAATRFTLTASPVEPHGIPEAFAIQLSVTSLTQQFAAGVDSSADLAIIEEWGVVQLGGRTLTGLEGGNVAIPIWRRYGSRGAIQVTGMALPSSSSAILPGQLPAQAGVDFPTSPMSVILQDRETVGYINIPLANNSVSSPIKVFTFQLTSVTRAPNPGFPVTTPRLSSLNTAITAQVSIVDDEGGAGLFQLSPTSAVVQEGNQFTFSVVRVQGNTGQLSVQLQTEANGLATSGADFVPLSQQLVFGDRETTRFISVTIVDDDVSEEAEGFSVVLSEPPGGAAVIDPQARSLDLTIAASDNPGGVFFFLTPSLSLSEDLMPSGVLQVRRDSQAVGLFGRVEVAWEALYTDGGTHPVSVDAILVNSRGTLVFAAGQTVPENELTLQLNPNSVPAGGEEFTVRLSSVVVGEIGLGVPSEVTVRVQPRTVAVFQISQENLMLVVSSPGRIFINIERTDGLALSTEVIYNTTQPRGEIEVGQIKFQPALAQRHFTSTETPVTFPSNEASRSVDVNIIAVPETPSAFQVMISSPIHQVSSANAAVVVLVSDNVLTQLYPIYFNARNVATSQELNDVAASLYDLLLTGTVSGQVRNHSDTVQATISTLISKTATIEFSTTDYVNTMLNIFHRIASDITFEGHSQFVQLMKQFAYSLVDRALCPIAGGGQPLTFTRTSFYMEAVKLPPASLSGRTFTSSSGDSQADYVQFPNQIISVPTDCVNVHFIEFFTENLFQKPTLRSKALSVGVDSEGIDLFPSSDQLIYRIYTDHSLGLLPNENDCLFWQYPLVSAGDLTPGSWGTSMCQPQSHFVNLENYITCTCRQLGDFAAANEVGVGYGWTFPAAITAGIVMVAMVLVVLVHLCNLSQTQLATKILINLCIAVGVFQLMLFISILAGDSPSISADGCAALGGLLQFTVIVQFVWILALGVALWINFMSFTDGREPLIFYILASWGLPIIIVVITILVWQFGVNRPLTELYGQRNTGEICFMPELSASLLSTALPVILALLATVALLSHSCVYWSRWEDFHNIYDNSFNKVEIPLLIGLFSVISLSAVAGYLHAYIGVVYTFAIFCVVNIIEAVYAIIVYFFISWHTLTRKHKYGLDDEVEPLSIPGEPDYLGSVSTLASGQRDFNVAQPPSRKKGMGMEMSEMDDKDSDASSQVGPGQEGIMTLGVRQFSSDTSLPRSRGTGPGPDPSGEDSNLDDLMFMLKTQNYDDDSAPLTSPRKREPKGEEHLELRRISIADTHL